MEDYFYKLGFIKSSKTYKNARSWKTVKKKKKKNELRITRPKLHTPSGARKNVKHAEQRISGKKKNENAVLTGVRIGMYLRFSPSRGFNVSAALDISISLLSSGAHSRTVLRRIRCYAVVADGCCWISDRGITRIIIDGSARLCTGAYRFVMNSFTLPVQDYYWHDRFGRFRRAFERIRYTTFDVI
jgi:hypothetical protein